MSVHVKRGLSQNGFGLRSVGVQKGRGNSHTCVLCSFAFVAKQKEMQRELTQHNNTLVSCRWKAPPPDMANPPKRMHYEIGRRNMSHYVNLRCVIIMKSVFDHL